MPTEVADSSLEYDGTVKRALYARAGIPELWILNLQEDALEVYRSPDTAAGNYGDSRTYGSGESVAPLAAPGSLVAIADLLP